MIKAILHAIVFYALGFSVLFSLFWVPLSWLRLVLEGSPTSVIFYWEFWYLMTKYFVIFFAFGGLIGLLNARKIKKSWQRGAFTAENINEKKK